VKTKKKGVMQLCQKGFKLGDPREMKSKLHIMP